MSLMIVMWNVPIFKSVKVVAVFIHEVGHYLMTILFNRKLAVFAITLDETKHWSMTDSGWFSSFLIASGGYIMSLLFAVLILRINKAKSRKYILGVLSSLVLVSLIYTKNTQTAFFYIVIFLVSTIVLYMLDNDKFFEYAIDIIGVSSIVYCIYETLMKDMLPGIVNRFGILKEIVIYSKVTTDSEVLCKLTGIPVFVWGMFWFLVSLAVLVFCMNVKKRKY